MQKKNITNITRLILYIWNIGLFAGIWITFYNSKAFPAHMISGICASIISYAIVYSYWCYVYSAFKIASSSISEIVFSHFISFGIADMICYVECCLICRRYVNIIPGAVVVVLQLLGTAIIVCIAKNFLIKRIIPQKTIILYGQAITREQAEDFKVRLLKKYDHLFDVVYLYSENVTDNILRSRLQECSTVFLYEIQSQLRVKYMLMCMENGLEFFFSPSLEDIFCQGSTAKHLFDTPLYKYEYEKDSREGAIKRLLDVIFFFFFLIVSLPLTIIIAIVIKLEDKGPVFYKQSRVTKNGKIFEIFKFRSMIVDAEKDGAVPYVNGDLRITKVGRWIRATRLDELPQLINILKGDMSFVGPRPERVEHVQKYTDELPEFSHRLRVKGGLTGYAQVYGKYNTTPYDKLRLDLIYIENQSILLDLKIMALTIKTIFSKESTEGFGEKQR